MLDPYAVVRGEVYSAQEGRYTPMSARKQLLT